MYGCTATGSYFYRGRSPPICQDPVGGRLLFMHRQRGLFLQKKINKIWGLGRVGLWHRTYNPARSRPSRVRIPQPPHLYYPKII